MENEVLSDLWDLRTNPFSPTESPDGGDFDPDLVEYTLDPRENPQIVKYYHDFYRWDESEQLDTILRGAGLNRTFEKRHFKMAIKGNKTAYVVLICGDGESGRKSLKNWILHKLSPSNPVVISARLGSERKTGALKAIADFFVVNYPKLEKKPSRKELQSIYEMKKPDLGMKAGPYQTMFNLFRDEVRESCDRPIVLDVTGGDHSDTWAMAWEATKNLAQLILITTHSDVQAGACYDRLSNISCPVSVIAAAPLDLASARSFLVSRLALHRKPESGAEPLAPFSEQVLNALYKKTGNGVDRGGLYYTIGWLTFRLRIAFEEHYKALTSGNGDPIISSDEIGDYMEDVNQGRHAP